MARVTVGEAMTASLGEIPLAWAKAAAILAIAVVLAIGFQLARSVPAMPLIDLLVSLFVNTAAIGAVFRLGLAPYHRGDPNYTPGAGGVAWSSLEWRVMGANMLIGVILFTPLVVILIVWGVGIAVALGGNQEALQSLQSGSQMDRLATLGRLMLGPAGIVSAVILIPVAIAYIYVGSRLSLFSLRAADTGSFHIGQAWAMTRGATWAIVAVSVAFYLLSLVVTVASGALAGVLAGLVGHSAWGGAWGQAIGQAVGVAVDIPLFAGLQLHVYLAQRDDRRLASVFA